MQKYKGEFDAKANTSIQIEFDTFYNVYVNMFGQQDVTNYIHYWSAGHTRYFLEKFGNLYIFCGIGGESRIGGIRGYFFKRTQREGHSGKKCNYSSLDAMGDYIARNALWTIADISIDPDYAELIYKKAKYNRIVGEKLARKDRKLSKQSIIDNVISHHPIIILEATDFSASTPI
jgi:hypothetical protein